MQNTSKKTLFIISLCIILLAAICMMSVFFLSRTSLDGSPVADIYQNGSLVMSIPLDAEAPKEPILFTSEDGGVNIVEIRDGTIGIAHADCPDLLCVRQGFIRSSVLPITCLPHRLVIQIRKE